jgi:hypothetical protein
MLFSENHRHSSVDLATSSLGSPGSGYDKFARALLLELFDGNGHTYEIVGILRDEGSFGRRIRDLF